MASLRASLASSGASETGSLLPVFLNRVLLPSSHFSCFFFLCWSWCDAGHPWHLLEHPQHLRKHPEPFRLGSRLGAGWGIPAIFSSIPSIFSSIPSIFGSILDRFGSVLGWEPVGASLPSSRASLASSRASPASSEASWTVSARLSAGNRSRS